MSPNDKSQHVQQILDALEAASDGHRPDLVCNAALWLIITTWRRYNPNTGPSFLVGWIAKGLNEARELLNWHDAS